MVAHPLAERRQICFWYRDQPSIKREFSVAEAGLAY
jgi:hypothetical protein